MQNKAAAGEACAVLAFRPASGYVRNMKSKTAGVLKEETFSDGSRLVHTEDGGWLILESDLAACNVVGLAHDRPVRYDEPPPLPPAKRGKP